MYMTCILHSFIKIYTSTIRDLFIFGKCLVCGNEDVEVYKEVRSF